MQEIKHIDFNINNKINTNVRRYLKKIDFVFLISIFSIWIKNLLFYFEINKKNVFNKIIMKIIASPKILGVIAVCIIFMIGFWIYLKKNNKLKIFKYMCFTIIAMVILIFLIYKKSYIILYMPFGLMLLSIGCIFKGKNRIIAYIAINFITSFIICMDSISLRMYGSLTSINYIFNFFAFNSSNRDFFHYLKLSDLLYFIDIVFFIFIYLKYSKGYIEMFKNRFKNIIVSFMLIIFSYWWICGIYYLYDIKDVSNGAHTFFTPGLWNLDGIAERTSSLGYHFYELGKNFTVNKVKKLNHSEERKIEEWYKNNRENLPNNKYEGILKNKNLIFLQVESLENFVINETVNGQEITPNLNKILSNCYYFKNIYDQAYHNSADGDFISCVGLLPLSKQSPYIRYAFNEYNTIAKIFNKKLYNTIAIHPETGGRWNWRDNHASHGFNKLYDDKDFTIDEIVGPSISDESLYRQTVDKIKNENSSFLIHITSLTSHGPFKIDEKYKSLNISKALGETVLGDYIQTINYADKAIGTFIRLLEESNLLKDTVLIIYGDHSSPHRQYQSQIDSIGEVKDLKKSWRERDIKVPFIIYNPNIDGEEIETIGGQIDILPTTLSLLGVEKECYMNSMMGRNLLNTKRNSTITIDGNIIGNPQSEEEKQHLLDMSSISDKIIESNYFKGKN